MSLSHQYVQDHIQMDRRLTPEEQAAVEEHLAACPECRAYAALHQTLLQTLPTAAAPLRHSDREIRQKIAIANAEIEKRRWPARFFHNTLAVTGVAAALVALLVILVSIPRMMPGSPVFAPAATRAYGAATVAADASGLADASSTAASTATTANKPTPTAYGAAANAAAPASTGQPASADALRFLSAFPMKPGTTWVYTSRGYNQAAGNPQKVIQGTSKIVERVAGVQTVPPYTIVHIQGNKTMVSADAGWQENGAFGLGDYQYWYVLQNNQVYLSYTAPDPKNIKMDRMLLNFQFPLAVGSEWCTSSLRRGTVENPTPDPNSPCEARRGVMAAGPYLSQVGALKSCYEIHDIVTSGDVVTRFCSGIGIVSVNYGHSGTQFGLDQELTGFTDGENGAALVAGTPTTANNSAQASGDVQSIPSPDGRWTVLYEKQPGQLQLEIEDAQGRRTRVGASVQWVTPGSWSPDSRYLLFWQGTPGVQADGISLWSVEANTGKTFQLSDAALLNPTYYSWAPDGHALVFTNGGYRSAQVNKWLSLYTPAGQQVTNLVPQEKLVPGAVAWSPDGKTIVFAAVDAARTGMQYADNMDWANPAILGRRLYRLDPGTSQYQRLDAVEAYQDAPRWSADGRLYFVQLDQEQAHVMVASAAGEPAQAVPGCQAARLTPAGYYGQVDWMFLYDACPETSAASEQSARGGVIPAVAVKGSTAYIGIGARLAAIDISRPSAPQLIAQSPELPGRVVKVIPLTNGSTTRVAASAGRYLAVLDASTPNDLGLITQSKLPGPITALIFDINTHRIYAGGALESDEAKGFIALLDAAAVSTGGPQATLQLLGTMDLPAPVQALALSNAVVYAAFNSQESRVSAIPLSGNTFGAPVDVLSTSRPIYSMTAAGGSLYIGSDRLFSAYLLTDSTHVQPDWNLEQSAAAPLPGPILGFEIRANAVYTAGLDAQGQPAPIAITPPESIKASSTVDTASFIAVANGLMLVSGDRLEIYDCRDPRNLKLLGAYP